MLYVAVIFVAIVIFLVLQFSLFIPEPSGLRVLLYHKIISSGKTDFLSVSTAQFEKQIQYILQCGYNIISLDWCIDYVKYGKTLPEQPLLLTFDDGYKNNFTELYPILQKYKIQAAIFLVPDFIQTGKNGSTFLNIDEIKKMDPAVVSFGLHSFNHKNYNELTIGEIDADIKATKSVLSNLQIPFKPCLAYTYGAFPKKDEAKRTELFKLLHVHNIELAFRIGNRVNPLPVQNNYLIKRIDIRGDEPFFMFRIKLKKGRAKLFG